MTKIETKIRRACAAEAPRSVAAVKDRLRAFREDESGVMVFLGMFIFLIILMTGGIAVDFMRNEQNRTQLQHTLDRAVLAAADLDQTLDPTQVVNSYFEKAGLSDFLAEVTVDEGLNFRTVSARAEAVQPAEYLQFVGRETLVASASATAEERIAKVEISMVLDISGSMDWNSSTGDGRKIDLLKTAANTFVDTVIKPDTHDLVSISMVPYSEHVNAGPLITDELQNFNQVHNYSHCVEIPDSEFSQARFDMSRPYDQMQHFQWNYNGYHNSRTDTVCPRYDYERIRPFSQDANQLKNQINQFQPRAGTSIFLGMKWGVGLLDPHPHMQSLVNTLVSKGEVDAELSGRPAAYDDPETLKTIILMTDGKNDRSNRIASWAYSVPSHYVHWDRYNLWYYLNRYVSSYQRSQFYYQKYDASKGDYLTDQICDAAKDKGIVIWSIGFEVDDHGADVMRDCASSPAHFFRVEGVEIREAFEAIARQINQLRLTQ